MRKLELLADYCWKNLSSEKAEWARFALLALGIFAVLINCPVADRDLFTRTAVGRLVELLGTAPDKDPFAFSVTKAIWHDHEWLIGFIYWKFLQFGGPLFLFLVNILACIITFGFLRRAQQILSPNTPFSFIFLCMAVVGSMNIWSLPIRAQAVTYLSFSIFLYIFVVFRVQKRTLPLFFLPLLMIFWMNSHGGFVVGLGVVGCFALVSLIYRDPGWPLVIVASILTFLSILVNPYGPSFLEFIFIAVTSNVPDDLIAEWHTLPVFSSQFIFTLLFLLGIGWSWFRQKPQRRLELLIFLVPMLYGGFKHQRFIPFFYFVAVVYATPLLSKAITELPLKREHYKALFRRSMMFTLGIGFCAALGTSALWVARGAPGFSYFIYPVYATQWMKENLPAGNVLLHYNDGSYALWKLYPKFKISVDGRYDGVYTRETIALTLDALKPEHPRQADSFKKLSPDYILLSNNLPAYQKAREMFPGFYKVYQDQSFAVYSKQRSQEVQSPDYETRSRATRLIWKPDF